MIMTNTQIQTGAVALFDILGFRGFLKENKASVIAEQVLSLISDIPNAMEQQAQFMAPDCQPFKELLADLKWLVFSDTILSYINLPPAVSREAQFTRLFWFLSSCLNLNRQMFEIGLPLRGAIDTGSFMIKGACFAGEPIVNAYDLGRDIDAAVSILSDDAYNKLFSYSDTKGFKNAAPFFPSMLIDYPVPTKSGRNVTSHVLNLFSIRIKGVSGFVDQDIKQYVLHSFWSHNKPLPEDAKRKADNTEMIFRYFDHKFSKMMPRGNANIRSDSIGAGSTPKP